MSSNPEINDLAPPPPFPGVNRLLLGAAVQPLDRVAIFSDKQFEIFTWEWIEGYKSNQYAQIQRCGGAYDEGRDVIAWIDPPNTCPRRWDNYQCKHYATKLTPSSFCVELGKLCYYTYTKSYTVPEHYYIVTHKGIGRDLEKLLTDKNALAEEVITTWDTRCKKNITSTKTVELTGDFLDYVKVFPFNIVSAVPPETLLSEHSQTKYHAMIFGVIPKERPPLVVPAFHESENATTYVRQIFAAFASHLTTSVEAHADFAHHADLLEVFKDARICFYTAESLKEFSRETFPDEEYFTELADQFYQGVKLTALAPYANGYLRMIRTCEVAVSLKIAHVLSPLIAPNDAKGMCHQLTNMEKLKWMP